MNFHRGTTNLHPHQQSLGVPLERNLSLKVQICLASTDKSSLHQIQKARIAWWDENPGYYHSSETIPGCSFVPPHSQRSGSYIRNGIFSSTLKERLSLPGCKSSHPLQVTNPQTTPLFLFSSLRLKSASQGKFEWYWFVCHALQYGNISDLLQGHHNLSKSHWVVSGGRGSQTSVSLGPAQSAEKPVSKDQNKTKQKSQPTYTIEILGGRSGVSPSVKCQICFL